MDHISKELREDFERWVRKIGDDPYVGITTVGIFDVLRAHYLIVDYFVNETGIGVGGIGPKDLNLLHSTLSRQSSGFMEIKKWSNNFDIVATLFYGLIKNHAFHDANKRTALLTLLYHLRKIHYQVDAPQKVWTQLAINIATNSLMKDNRYETFFKKFKNNPDSDVAYISDFLRRNTRRIDKIEYLITYNDLNSILIKNGFRLENPNGNKIDIVTDREEVKWSFFKRTTILKITKVGTISFPGWTRQVPLSEIKLARRFTKLVDENGVDSQAFFRGADPLATLISQFSEPLKRLANR